jgi:hypothetical protein
LRTATYDDDFPHFRHPRKGEQAMGCDGPATKGKILFRDGRLRAEDDVDQRRLERVAVRET